MYKPRVCYHFQYRQQKNTSSERIVGAPLADSAWRFKLVPADINRRAVVILFIPSLNCRCFLQISRGWHLVLVGGSKIVGFLYCHCVLCGVCWIFLAQLKMGGFNSVRVGDVIRGAIPCTSHTGDHFQANFSKSVPCDMLHSGSCGICSVCSCSGRLACVWLKQGGGLIWQ